MICKDIEFGTQNCCYNIMLPYYVTDPCIPNCPEMAKTVAIDKCLLPEIISLWEKGVKTTGCCCGHDKLAPYIGVQPEYIDKMLELGYKVAFNTCRPEDSDSFIPKTKFNYGEIDKGFNWWDD